MVEIDHAFVCCAPGAPESEALLRSGLREGSPNSHPDQGTACRRFFFANAYLELLWVTSPEEAQSPRTRRTRLWERWSQRTAGASPFGIGFRPQPGALTAGTPFATWAYRPGYLPEGFAIEFADGATLDEPELFYLPFARRSGPPAGEPVGHPLDASGLEGLAAGLAPGKTVSMPSFRAQSAGLVSYFAAPAPVLELTFLSGRPGVLDLRPDLPMVLRTLRAGAS